MKLACSSIYLMMVSILTTKLHYGIIVFRRNCGVLQIIKEIVMSLKCASFFAGVGGIDLGFKNAGFSTIYANEFDSYATETFELNHNLKVDTRDIHDVPTSEIPEFDIMLAGFPCQAAPEPGQAGNRFHPPGGGHRSGI